MSDRKRASESRMPGIVGFGGYVPERVVTNDDWSARLDTSDDWITQRTGIKRRRFADDNQSTVDLAFAAARAAILDAGLTPDEIDEIIVATDTPEMMTPDTASFLQHRLGCREIPAYDLGGSGCAGFVMALDLASSRITVTPKHVLVIGVELISRLLSLEERATAILFGDGAGAVVMGPSNSRCEMLGAVSGTDGSESGILNVRVGGTRYPFSQAAIDDGSHGHIVMDGPAVFKHAVARMTESVAQLLERIDRKADEVSLIVPHQANLRIIDAVRRRTGVDVDRIYVNVDEYGNTGSASVPMALAHAVAQARISQGDLVVLTAFGAGFHWASAALQF